MRIGADLGPLRERGLWILLSAFLTVILLMGRLVQLQVFQYRHWADLALNNRLRRIPVPAMRGRIFDRSGRVLAENQPSWQLLLFPDELKDSGKTLLFLSENGIGNSTELRESLRHRGPGAMAPLVAAESLSFEEVACVEAHQQAFPELSVVSRFRRVYPAASLTAHVIGYLRHPTLRELKKENELEPSELLGASGVEKLANDTLKGKAGTRWVVASAVGQQLGVLKEEKPNPGQALSISIDLMLQEAAKRALGDHAGAIVAMDVHSGAIRAMYSAPSFDPDIFSGNLSQARWTALSENSLHPLQNRCLQGGYPPGSTIKPFLALAGLENGRVDTSTRVFCNGAATLYGHVFRCWRHGGHGSVNMKRALEGSCDVYFYQLGQKLGISEMARWLGLFGLGHAINMGLGSETSGLIGTPEWSRRVRKSPWYPGESVSVSIGQGPVLVNTVQLVRAFAALANGGMLVQPRLIEGEIHARPIPIKPAHLEIIRKDLEAVVHGSGGTARILSDLPVAGKTGTAQVVRLPEPGQHLAPEQQHHAWFAGWIPLKSPQVAVAVLVEHGGGGGSVAAPAARIVFEELFRTEIGSLP